ncbi:MAG: cytochrome P450, partial [Actinobacteria bacterium]|nr:cytochrome P450 [Actinomycetota bacterium]
MNSSDSNLPDSAVNLADPKTYEVGPPIEFFNWLRSDAPVWWHDSDEYPPGFWVC